MYKEISKLTYMWSWILPGFGFNVSVGLIVSYGKSHMEIRFFSYADCMSHYDVS